jgi:hypothetical protein
VGAWLRSYFIINLCYIPPSRLHCTVDIPANVSDFTDVILHEMAHCLGFGTVWSNLNLLSAPCNELTPGPIYYTGANGNAAYSTTNCGTWSPQPLVETSTGSAGSDCGHWAESNYREELMTPVRCGLSLQPPSPPNGLASSTDHIGP